MDPNKVKNSKLNLSPCFRTNTQPSKDGLIHRIFKKKQEVLTICSVSTSKK